MGSAMAFVFFISSTSSGLSHAQIKGPGGAKEQDQGAEGLGLRSFKKVFVFSAEG